MTVNFDAVIVAGGRASRLGGVSKGDVLFRGMRLVDLALAATAKARTQVVVGDVEVPDGVLLTREEPAFTGPAAGCLAGLRVIADPSDWVVLLACDLADSGPAVSLLTHTAPVTQDGICLLGPDGRKQWLLGCYRRSRLLDAAEILGSVENRSMRAWLEQLDLVEIAAPVSTDDIDTWADHARLEGQS